MKTTSIIIMSLLASVGVGGAPSSLEEESTIFPAGAPTKTTPVQMMDNESGNVVTLAHFISLMEQQQQPTTTGHNDDNNNNRNLQK